MNMFARFDEIPTMTLQDMKETKRYGWSYVPFRIIKGNNSNRIEEFPIIGFYLYHVTSAGQSSNWTTSGIKQHILTVDLTS